MTIKMRILIPMIIFTIVASSVILISNIVQFSHYVEDDINKQLNMAALTALNEINNLKIQAKSSSSYITKDSFIRTALEEENWDELYRRVVQLNDNTGVDFCIITDPEGVIQVSTHNPKLQGVYGTSLESVLSALSGQIITTIEEGISVSLTVSAAAPIYNEKGVLLGVVMTGFPLSTDKFVDSIKEITGCEVSICREDIRVATTMTQEDGSRVTNKKAPDEISKYVLEGKVYSGKTQIMSSELISKYHPLFGSNKNVIGMLFVGHYTNEATETIGSFVQMGLLITLLLTMVFVFFISNISEYIVTPINEAAGVLNQISKGDFDARVLGNYKGDLALIKSSVNDTALELSVYLKDKLKAEQIANESERAKVRAEEASLVKSEFLASMSHEIRTPMNAIIGMSELLLNEPLNNRQHRYVRDIKVSSTALLGILNDILDSSKIEAGKLTLTSVHFMFAPFINNISSMMSYSAESKGLKFKLDVDESLPKCLYGDDVRLRQILVNLISNAIKFTESGYIRFATEYKNGVIHFTITDTGIGIKKSDIGRLFDSFEQFEAVKNRHKQGTGLGLPITKSLINMMQGEIHVSSKYGEGTTFTVDIPLPTGDESQAENSEKPMELLSAKDAAILLVDDNEANRNVGRGLLKLNDIVCDTASDGMEAIKMIQERDYDIVFMDHMMPGIDGIETVSRIRAMKGKYEQLVIIALSANAMTGAKEMFIRAGMNDFLAKPIDRILLIQMLKRWLPSEKVQIIEKISSKEGEDDLIISKLRQIDMIDVDTALVLTSGSMELYKSTLQIIMKHMLESIDTMIKFLENDELECFVISIHGMKNSLATIGAEGLSKQALEMETAASVGNAALCNQLFPEFSKQCLFLNSKMNEIFTKKAKTPLYKGDLQILRKELGKIKQYIEDFEDEPVREILASLHEYDFGEPFNELLKALNKQIELFEYEKVANLVNDFEKYM